MADRCPHCKRVLVSRYFAKDRNQLLVLCAKCDSVAIWPTVK